MHDNPNQTYADLAHKIWAYSGNLIFVVIPSTDPEVVHNVVLVVDDLLKIEDDHSMEPISDHPHVVAGAWGTVYSGLVRYTTHHDAINAALTRVADQHGLEGVAWTTGPPIYASATNGAPAVTGEVPD